MYILLNLKKKFNGYFFKLKKKFSINGPFFECKNLID